jgi:ABC-2 type transport system ATP-binding protein/lipopolysaccharide transport system ATP-binding protein
MAEIRLNNVSVDFPMYQMGARSLKKTLLHATTGGRISRDAGLHVTVEALANINLDIENGDRVALVGPNGAGKSTLLRVMAGTYEPTRGEVHSQGRIAAMLDTSLGLNHDATGYENIILRGLYLGLSPRQASQYIGEIAEFTELGDYLSLPLRAYSSGMILRLAFGIATCIQPEILLMDEWLLAGDSRFLEKAHKRMAGFVGHSKILVLASHLEGIIRQWCTKAVFLEGGRVKAYGRVDDVLDLYHASQLEDDPRAAEAGEGETDKPADMVVLAQTPSNDGVLTVNRSDGAGAFSVSGANIGGGSLVTVTADTGGARIPVVLFVCQTDPATGACVATPSPSLSLRIEPGATPTFTVFVNVSGDIPFDMARHRVFVRFMSAGGDLVGATSIAVKAG